RSRRMRSTARCGERHRSGATVRGGTRCRPTAWRPMCPGRHRRGGTRSFMRNCWLKKLNDLRGPRCPEDIWTYLDRTPGECAELAVRHLIDVRLNSKFVLPFVRHSDVLDH